MQLTSKLRTTRTLLMGLALTSCGGGGGSGGLIGGDSEFLYASNFSAGSMSMFGVDSSTGGLTLLGTPLTATAPAYAIATDPAGNFAYGASSNGNQVNAYAIDASSGKLSPIANATYFSGGGQVGITVDPMGKWVLTANQGTNNVSVFAIAANGTLSEVTNSPFAADANPWAVAVDPQGEYAFVANAGSDDVSVYALNASTGMLTAAPNSPFVTAGSHPQSLAVSPNGNFLYVVDFSSEDISIFSIDRSNGALTLAGSLQHESGLAIVVAPNGNYAYLATGLGVEIFSIDSTTGLLTDLGAAPTPQNSRSTTLVINSAGTSLFVLDNLSDNVNVYNPSSADGSLTLVNGSPFALDNGTQGLGPTALALWH